MKRVLLSIVVLAMCALSYAQKTEFRFQDTQARLLDVTSNAYVKPLTVELDIKGRIDEPVPLSKQVVEQDMKGDLANIRSYAIYYLSKLYNCDVIVAATFNVHTVDGGYEVNVIGYPANFVNWKTATKDDYEWIRMEKTATTSEREKIAAAIKN